MKCPQQANLWRQKVEQWLPGAEKKREWGEIANGRGVSLADDENVLELGSGDGCTNL